MTAISASPGWTGAWASAAAARPLAGAEQAPPSTPVDLRRGYPVGDGRFAGDVRGTQPQAGRDLHFAMMANDAYRSNAQGPTGSQSERELAQAGWQRLRPVGDHLVDAQGHRIPISPELLHDPKTGFDAAIYQNAQGQYVVAYRGTDSWSLGQGGDATTNAGQGAGLRTEQYQQAIDLARRADKVFGPGNVAITGHSLGGGLASAAMLAVDAPGVTFNAAGLSDNSLRSLGFASPNAVRSELADSGQIRRYNVAGELLTNVQQGTALPDAVGHELRIAPPAGGGRDPVTLHGGGGDGSSYVEALRENSAQRPAGNPLLDRTSEHLGESVLKVLAASGTHAWGAATGSAAVLGQTAREMTDAVREDLVQGRVAQGAGRVAGSAANGVADVGAVVLHRGADLAGDVLMEQSTLVGNVLRNTGEAVGLARPLNGAAEAVERAGYRANQRIDQAGAAAARWLDQAGDAAQQLLDRLGAGAQRGLDRAAAGVAWAGRQVVAGAQWAGSQAANGVKWAANQAEAGAQWVGERVSDAGHWVGRRLNPANWF